MAQKKQNNGEQIPSYLLDQLSPQANKETYRKYFTSRNCSEIRRLLSMHLRKKIEGSVQKGDNVERFELPSWPQYQANEVGYRRAIREILDIIER